MSQRQWNRKRSCHIPRWKGVAGNVVTTAAVMKLAQKSEETHSGAHHLELRAPLA
jgi:hypothetical protein